MRVVSLAVASCLAGTQARVGINDDVVADYAAALVAGARFPPIVVFHDGTTYWTGDGFHRLTAAALAGAKRIRAEVRRGTQRDAVLYAVGANATHGLRRTNADKRHAVELLLGDKEWRRWSDREISRRCCVSDFLVAECRRSLQESCSEKRTYRTRHGTVATMDTAAIGRIPSLEEVIGPPRVDRLDVHFSSETAEHYTPAPILAAVVACLGAIDLDPCSNSKTAPNVTAAQHFTVEDDGLRRTWRGRVYMNPPYGREIDAWVEKLTTEHRAGRVSEAIALVPARPDTQWFHRLRDYVCCFIEGRLTFVGNTDPAPFPSALFYLGPEIGKFWYHFSGYGDIWQRVEPGMFGE
jgi:hypothetical protein